MNPVPKTPHQGNLFLKIAVVVIITNLSLALGIIFHLKLIFTLAILAVTSIINLGVIYTFLLPLKSLLKFTVKFINGQTNERFNIQTGDEIEELALAFSQINQNLSQTLTKTLREKDLLVSEKNKLATIISSITDGIIVVDLHKKIILANQSALNIIGIPGNEVLKQNLEEIIKLTDKTDRILTSDEYCPISLTPSDTPKKFKPNEPVVLTNKANKKSQIRLTSTSVIGNTQADLGCVLIFHDLTQETALEAMQVDFVSMASHELRTPLTSILGYLNVLAEDGKNNFTTTQKDFVNKILTASQQLAVLVNNLLNVSRVERGAFSISSRPLDWAKTLTQAVDENKLQAAQKNISLELNLPQTLPSVSADPVRMMEVLNNLISNAVNYTPEGGIIKIAAKIGSNEVITMISDNGKGIPKEAIPHLFTKFFRVTYALDTSSNSKGTGLGLYLSKSIVELHHGKIWVESAGINKGSTFYFSLPISTISKLPSNFPNLNSKPLDIPPVSA
ncbi:PAS domain-containing protein [Candidatus Daviesbacteria bacterium]|nr:PAS domain-containing protein [Candidatus Daviesbacteria bacterium]